MKPLIEIDSLLCTMCYACVRTCPVKALKISSSQQMPQFVNERCIGCGNCTISCSYNAIKYSSAKERVSKLISSDEKVVAICDPSIAGEFSDISDYRKFVQMIRLLGFQGVFEISFGVDLVAKQYKNLIEHFKGKYYITSNCPVVVFYIEKFYPELIPNLAPIVSPRIATALAIRSQLGNDVKIVEISPCIAAKNEILKYDGLKKIDEVLTFEELRLLFDEKDINEGMVEYSDFDEPVGYMGSIFPISNGILQVADLNEKILEGSILTAEGKVNTMNALREFETSIENINAHFNLFYCEGCMMGPGTSKNGKKLIRRSLVTKYANKRTKSFDIQKWDLQRQQYTELDFSCTFKNDDQRMHHPEEEEISGILQSMGKEAKDEEETGCGSCGFSSCREHAIAVAQGLSIPQLCNTFSMQSQNKYIKSLKQTNEKLAQMQVALKESEKKAHKEHEASREASDMTNTMLKKLPAGLVIINKDLKVILANDSFISMLGDEVKEINEVIPGLVGADIKTLFPYTFYNLVTYVLESNEEIQNKDIHIDQNLLNVSVFPIKTGKIAGAVIRDMYTPEVRSEEVVTRVSEVIDKNLEMVQQIGFLLGEGASETERMLNSIMESFKKRTEK